MKYQLWISAIVCMVIGLTACSTISTRTSTVTTPASWQTQKNRVSAIDNWQLDGKIAVQTAGDSGSASVNWTQHHNRYAMSLMGPLGTHGLELKGQPGSVTLYTADGQQFNSTSPEALLSKQWGWNLPVSNLKYWVRGLPVPNIPFDSRFDDHNRLAMLTQAGWTVQYQGYTTVNGYNLPNRLSITSPSLKSKIVIYNWQVS